MNASSTNWESPKLSESKTNSASGYGGCCCGVQSLQPSIEYVVDGRHDIVL
jgi:hypothetical protein